MAAVDSCITDDGNFQINLESVTNVPCSAGQCRRFGTRRSCFPRPSPLTGSPSRSSTS
jgi:hypothetical protein